MTIEDYKTALLNYMIQHGRKNSLPLLQVVKAVTDAAGEPFNKETADNHAVIVALNQLRHEKHLFTGENKFLGIAPIVALPAVANRIWGKLED